MATALASDWTEDDLSRQVVLALGFARGVLDDIDSAADSPLRRIAQKVVAETAMLLYAVAHLRATHPQVETACASLASRLAPLARSTEVQAAVCMDPGKALDHAMAHILLDRLGYADAAVNALLGVVLEVQEVDDGNVNLLPITVATPDALFHALRVPRQIEVNQRASRLQVQAFAGGISTD